MASVLTNGEEAEEHAGQEFTIEHEREEVCIANEKSVSRLGESVEGTRNLTDTEGNGDNRCAMCQELNAAAAFKRSLGENKTAHTGFNVYDMEVEGVTEVEKGGKSGIHGNDGWTH